MRYLKEKIGELENWRPELTREPDFGKFWEETLAEGRNVPLRPERRMVEYPSEYVKVYEISYCGFDETRIFGWLVIPRFVGEGAEGAGNAGGVGNAGGAGNADGMGNADGGKSAARGPKLPCLIQYHGFTDSRGFPWQLMHWAMMGMAVLAMDCRDQGGVTGNCARYTGAGQVMNVVTKGLLDPREYYYRAVYVDCIRALDFAAGCPEVDDRRIVVRGTSQGGALGMAVCALDDRPALGIVNVPSNSNMEERIIGNSGSFSAVNEYLKHFPDNADQVLKTLSYFDTMNMADQIRCPVFASVALGDQVCPARCYYASYNRISGPKQITVYPFNGHDGAGNLHMERELWWVRGSGILD